MGIIPQPCTIRNRPIWRIPSYGHDTGDVSPPYGQPIPPTTTTTIWPMGTFLGTTPKPTTHNKDTNKPVPPTKKEGKKDKGKKKATEKELITQEHKELDKDRREVQLMLERLQNEGAALEHKENIPPDIVFSIETLFTGIDNLKREKSNLKATNEALKTRNNQLEAEVQQLKSK
ncbi:hypothetical protein BDQ17DRAFT_1478970 [Cyathus striatus]|nr:hypothetical protein BDQ17DRAFT_1478970 [Cyathus striatus]